MPDKQDSQQLTVKEVLNLSGSCETVLQCSGLGGAALVCGLFPFASGTLASALTLTCLLGLCSGIAFGSSYQLVSHFSTTCNVALTIGERRFYLLSRQVRCAALSKHLYRGGMSSCIL